MREIKFRGKRIDTGEWVYGYYVKSLDSFGEIHKIHMQPNEPGDDNVFQIDPATLGQYTGLKDKNGKEIYEGDKVNYAVKKKICPDCASKEIHSDLEYGVSRFCPNCGKPLTDHDFITEAVVVYSQAAFGYKHIPKEGYYQFWPVYANEVYVEWVEIIGSIHYRPELTGKET